MSGPAVIVSQAIRDMQYAQPLAVLWASPARMQSKSDVVSCHTVLDAAAADAEDGDDDDDDIAASSVHCSSTINSVRR